MLAIVLVFALIGILGGLLSPDINSRDYRRTQIKVFATAGVLLVVLVVGWVMIVASQPADTPLTWQSWGGWGPTLIVFGTPVVYLVTATLRVQLRRRDAQRLHPSHRYAPPVR